MQGLEIEFSFWVYREILTKNKTGLNLNGGGNVQ